MSGTQTAYTTMQKRWVLCVGLGRLIPFISESELRAHVRYAGQEDLALRPRFLGLLLTFMRVSLPIFLC
jgi:hypothetical protein